jgi:hypothetical protein
MLIHVVLDASACAFFFTMSFPFPPSDSSSELTLSTQANDSRAPPISANELSHPIISEERGACYSHHLAKKKVYSSITHI